MDLSGKVVLVTGAGRRLGREIAEALAGRGARIAVHYRESRAEAEAVAATLGGRPFPADLARVEEVLELPARVEAEMGRLDAVVNSASVFARRPFGQVDAADLAVHMDVNLRAPLLLTQEFARRLPPDREGRVLNLLDTRAEVADRNYLSYSLSKAGLACLTRGLAVALSPRIRVFGLALGYMLAREHEPPGTPPPGDALVPGLAPPGTTGEAAAFLLGPGDFATGAILELDGGRHLRAPGGFPPGTDATGRNRAEGGREG